MVEFYSNRPMEITNSFQKTIGGDVFNLLSMAQLLGSKTGFVTKLGDDIFSKFLKQSFLDRNIDITSVISCHGYTGLYFVVLQNHGQREFTYYRSQSAASKLSKEDLDLHYLCNTKVLHSSGITQAISKPSCQAVAKAFHAGKTNGVTISYDPNIRSQLCSLQIAKGNFLNIAPYIDILLPSQQELCLLMGTDSLPKAINKVINLGIDTIAIKKGKNGCQLIHKNESTSYSAMTEISIKDTTGAGDTFNGAFLHGIAVGMAPRDAAQLAIIASGLKCRKRGAVDSQPSKHEVFSYYSTTHTLIKDTTSRKQI